MARKTPTCSSASCSTEICLAAICESGGAALTALGGGRSRAMKACVCTTRLLVSRGLLGSDGQHPYTQCRTHSQTRFRWTSKKTRDTSTSLFFAGNYAAHAQSHSARVFVSST